MDSQLLPSHRIAASASTRRFLVAPLSTISYCLMRIRFNILFSGGRTTDGQYARLEAHGFYWTASESDSASAWFYNFGQAGYLNRHNDGEKQRAFAVPCV